MKGKRSQVQMDERLSAYIDGELTAGELAQLEARLAVEPELRDRLESLHQTVTWVQNLDRVPAPRNFLLTPSMVAPVQSRFTPRRWLAPALTFATATSALLFALVLAGSMSATFLMGQLYGPASEEAAYPVAAVPEGELLYDEAPAEGTPQLMAVEEEVAEGMAITPTGEPGAPPADVTIPAPAAAEDTSATDDTDVFSTPSQAVGGLPMPTASPSKMNGSLPTPTATPLHQPSPEAERSATATSVAPTTATAEAQANLEALASPIPSPVSEAVEEPNELGRFGRSWFLVGGLGLLTLILAAATFLSWRARR